MHPLVPNFILERTLAGERKGSFPAVGLFLDISGFSTMVDALMAHGQHGAEVLADVMRAVLDPLIDQVCAQDGFIASSAGDAFTALFPQRAGAPPAALRGLAAASAIQERMAQAPQYATPYGKFKISAKVGLSAGEAHWGVLVQGEQGASQADDRPAVRGGRAIYYFQGQAVEGCAQVEHLAQAGQVLVDQAVLVAGGACVTCQLAGEDAWRVEHFNGPWPAPLPLPDLLDHPRALDAAALFFPKTLLTQAAPGEFRQAASLFIGMPAVRTETQLALFVETLFELQDRYGGHVNRLDFGDKGTNLLLFWGVPVAYENDIERALNFILDLQTLTSIPINGGMTYRISHAGFIGGQRYEEYTCFGRGVSLAARFLTSAPRGEIWLDEPVAQRAGSRFEVEFVKSAPFKGFKVPQKVFVLLERKEQDKRFYHGRLTGREADLARLNELLAPLLRGEPAGAVLVTGEAGIGKSRLVHAFLESLVDSSPVRLQVFLAQTDEILRQSFNPLVYWLRRYFGISETQGEARSKRSFNRRLDELIAALSAGPDGSLLAEELDRTRSALGAMVGLHWPDSLYEQLDAAGRYANTISALTALLQAESRQAPVVLLLEDIHWLDADTIAFLAHLARVQRVTPYPIAVLATSRPGVGSPLLNAFGCCELALSGINRGGLESLARDQLGGPVSAALLEMLAQRAEGNPFYAEQILRYLKDDDMLEQRDGQWEMRPGSIQALPVDVNVLLVARLDRLSQRVKEVVLTAAVLGREFEVTLLSQMLHAASTGVLPEVETAAQEAIWTALSEIRYIFQHTLLREAAYQMQLLQRRQSLHALAMQAYESLFAGRLQEAAGELAYHAEQAGLPAPAVRYLKMAGDAACEAYHNAQAIGYYSRALALLSDAVLPGDPSVPGGSTLPAQERQMQVELLLGREQVLMVSGSTEARRADLDALEALLPLLQADNDRFRIFVRLADWHRDHSDHTTSLQYSQQALQLAEAGAHLDKQATIWSQMADVLLKQGHLEEARENGLQALRLARAAQDLTEESRALNTLGLINHEMGRLEEAREYYVDSLLLARQVGNLRMQVGPINNLGMIEGNRGNYNEALRRYDEVQKLGWKTGYLEIQALAFGNLGFMTGQMGDYLKAREYLEKHLHILRVIGHSYYETYGLINLSATTGALGDAGEAGRLAQQGLVMARQVGDRSGEAWAFTYLGHSHLALGQLEAAREAYQAALALRDELQQPVLAAEPAAGLARIALQQGDLPAAQRVLEPVLAHLDSGGSLDGNDQPLRVYLTCTLVLEQAGDPRAQELLSSGYAQLMDQAAKISDPAVRQAFLENIPHHREIVAAAQNP